MSRCPECGNLVPPNTTCRDRFYEMLTIEAEVPGGPTGLAHFFAVASYNLQHPSQFVSEAVTGLFQSLRDAVEGRASVAELRRRASRAFEGSARVLRRPEDPPSVPAGWPNEWPMTVADMCGVAPTRYNAQAEAWARSVVATISASGAGGGAEAKA